LWELGFPARLESGSSTLRGELGARFLWFVCGPFVDQGAQGEEEYPQHSLGVTSEVFMVSKRGARRNTSVGEHIRVFHKVLIALDSVSILECIF
jgi:hypothetical protein